MTAPLVDLCDIAEGIAVIVHIDTSRNSDLLQTGTVEERPVIDLHAGILRQSNGGKLSAVFKGGVADPCNALGEGHAGDVVVASEGLFAYLGDRIAVDLRRNGHIPALAGVAGDPGVLPFDQNIGSLFFVIFPIACIHKHILVIAALLQIKDFIVKIVVPCIIISVGAVIAIDLEALERCGFGNGLAPIIIIALALYIPELMIVPNSVQSGDSDLLKARTVIEGHAFNVDFSIRQCNA